MCTNAHSYMQMRNIHSNRLGKVFGARGSRMKLCYKPLTTSQVLYIETEELLRAALHSVQVSCCNTLQHTATRCRTLQHAATHCNTLQHTATQCTQCKNNAAHCNTP